jgi:hypothetical protein
VFDSSLTFERTFDILRTMARTRVRWGRALGAGLGGLLAVGLVAGRAGAGATKPVTGRPLASQIFVVHAGDTLWSIAARVVGPTGDPRPVVDRLVGENHVVDGLILPGERLSLTES